MIDDSFIIRKVALKMTLFAKFNFTIYLHKFEILNLKFIFIWK